MFTTAAFFGLARFILCCSKGWVKAKRILIALCDWSSIVLDGIIAPKWAMARDGIKRQRQSIINGKTFFRFLVCIIYLLR
jgi:hypothetical protein